jgi:hypothetical protein
MHYKILPGCGPCQMRVPDRDSRQSSPSYRAEREVSEERAWQELVNVLRRLVGLRIKRTGQQAYDEYQKQFGDLSPSGKAVH